MRKLQLPYATALNLARESRLQLTPNHGFKKQLRIWEFCEYSVYTDESGAADAQTTEDGPSTRREKAPYKAWKAEWDNILQKGEEHVNKARFSGLANMAAAFGRRRQEGEAGTKRVEGGEGEGEDLDKSLDGEKRKEAWERVQKMEQGWNDRLMRGHISGDRE